MSADTELEGLDPELEAILAKDDTEITLDELRELFGADLDVDSRFTIAQVITAMERSFENGKAHIEMVERCKARAALDASGIGELIEALEKCRDKFLYYEDSHRLKCTAEGDEKADRNREMADMCDVALSRARATVGNKDE